MYIRTYLQIQLLKLYLYTFHVGFFFNRVLQSDHQKVKLYINLFGKVFFEVMSFEERDFLSRINNFAYIYK